MLVTNICIINFAASSINRKARKLPAEAVECEGGGVGSEEEDHGGGVAETALTTALKITKCST